MFYINQIVRVLPDDHDVVLPDYGIVYRKDEGYKVSVIFNFQYYDSHRWHVKRSRITKSDRRDL